MTMLTETLQERAGSYVAGAMTAAERESFEVVLEYHAELRAHVAALQEAAAEVWLAQPLPGVVPPADLKNRLFAAVEALPPAARAEALVVTDVRGRIEWVNPAFTAMCGFELAELKGRKPGEVLQGPATDREAVARIRASVRERRACRETLVNYHKSGATYRAEVSIAPVLDEAGEPLWFVAKEYQLAASQEAVPGGGAGDW